MHGRCEIEQQLLWLSLENINAVGGIFAVSWWWHCSQIWVLLFPHLSLLRSLWMGRARTWRRRVEAVELAGASANSCWHYIFSQSCQPAEKTLKSFDGRKCWALRRPLGVLFILSVESVFPLINSYFTCMLLLSESIHAILPSAHCIPEPIFAYWFKGLGIALNAGNGFGNILDVIPSYLEQYGSS